MPTVYKKRKPLCIISYGPATEELAVFLSRIIFYKNCPGDFLVDIKH